MDEKPATIDDIFKVLDRIAESLETIANSIDCVVVLNIDKYGNEKHYIRVLDFGRE